MKFVFWKKPFCLTFCLKCIFYYSVFRNITVSKLSLKSLSVKLVLCFYQIIVPWKSDCSVSNLESSVCIKTPIKHLRMELFCNSSPLCPSKVWFMDKLLGAARPRSLASSETQFNFIHLLLHLFFFVDLGNTVAAYQSN